MHDTFTLQKAGRNHEDIKKKFEGVFPTEFVEEIEDDKLYIFNTQDSSQGGIHWIAVSTLDGEKEFFDSYGHKPTKHNPSWTFLDKFRRSKRQLQQYNTTVCGDYCLFYILRKSLGENLASVVKSFSDDLENNDEQIYLCMHSIFPTILNDDAQHNNVDLGEYHGKKIVCQICKQFY